MQHNTITLGLMSIATFAVCCWNGLYSSAPLNVSSPLFAEKLYGHMRAVAIGEGELNAFIVVVA